MRKILTRIGLALPALASLIIASLLSVGPAEAAKHKTLELQFRHYEQCLDWMFHNPAKHKKFCGPGHEFILNPNLNSAPYADSPAFPPSVTPPAPTCPTYDHTWSHGTSYDLSRQYGAEVLLTTGGYGGGYGGDHKDDPCHPDKPSCPVSWTGPTDGFAPSLLEVSVSYGCPSVCDGAYVMTPGTTAPGIILARRERHEGSWGGSCASFYEMAPLAMPQLTI